MSIYLLHDNGIHGGISYHRLENWTLEHNNTGKSPQKCYSRIDEGMDKLTEVGEKYARVRVLMQCYAS